MNDRRIFLLAGIVLLAACAPHPPAETRSDLAVLWVRDSAEWRALALQAYGAASEDLPRLLADRSFSALPDQRDAAGKPPAIIVDVDETLVSNVLFQLDFEPPFENYKLDAWNEANPAIPVPGAAEFVQEARDAGVTVFFVTNRPCEEKVGAVGACPQETVTLQDLRETGIDADADHLMLANEQADWDREKKVRRDLIAKDYRVIMLIGDDLGDFIACVRVKPVAPCTDGATKESREQDTFRFRHYWGNGWYMLPNPMHGSWTSAD